MPTATKAKDRLKGATRWSMTAKCPRQAFYAFQGVDPVEPDEETQRRFERGRMDERWYIERLRKKWGRKNVRTQKAVPWPNEGLPLGELHTDAFIVPLAQPIEVKSHLAGAPSQHDLIQLAGEIFFDEEAGDTGALVVLDRDLNERILTVTLDDELRGEVQARAQALLDGVLNDRPPERVCMKPSDGRQHLCPFIEHCFEGWEQPEVPRVETEEVVRLARQLYEVDAIDRSLKGSKVDTVLVSEALADNGMDAAIATLREGRTLKGVELLKKQIKAELSAALGRAPEDFLRDPGEYEVGPLVLKRNQVNRAGYTVDPCTYETLTVRKASDAPLLDEREWGEVPF
jgi:hypothetical protein